MDINHAAIYHKISAINNSHQSMEIIDLSEGSCSHQRGGRLWPLFGWVLVLRVGVLVTLIMIFGVDVFVVVYQHVGNMVAAFR